MVENGFAAPGRLIVGADSHTTTYGAVGCASTGLGLSEIGYIMNRGEIWFRVPESIKITLKGKPARFTMARDIMLYLAGRYSQDLARYRSIEFHGPTVASLTISSRMSMANLAVDLGAKFGLFVPDKKVDKYLENRVLGPYEKVFPDEDAEYSDHIEVNIKGLAPQVACHPQLGNVVPVEELGQIAIDQAFLGSCTNGRLEDLHAGRQRFSKDRKFTGGSG